MNKNIPKTKEECFAMLDAMLSEEDKKLIVEDNVFDLHFTLGLWIRNNWIYPLDKEEERSLVKMFMEEDDDSPFRSMYIHPDILSSTILEKYVEYLINKS